MFTLHIGSRCYTPDLHVFTIDILVLALSWHEGLYPGVEEMVPCVCRQEVTACFVAVFVANFLPSQVLHKVSREMKITGPHTVSRYSTMARRL